MKKEPIYTVTPKGEDGFYVKQFDKENRMGKIIAWFKTMEKAERYAKTELQIWSLKNIKSEIEEIQF